MAKDAAQDALEAAVTTAIEGGMGAGEILASVGYVLEDAGLVDGE